MNMQQLPLGFHERVSFTLRALYNRYGYSQYKMSKFEEYDLYARNKDFLISDSVITFTDTNGKLMALKPDVTLSIVKNTRDTEGSVRKLYYDENVYRVAKGSRTFREITQVGLECIGDIDDYCICEVLLLAAQSLQSISENCILDISHLGLLSQILDGVGIPSGAKAQLFRLIGEKNLHELADTCRGFGIPEDHISLLRQLVTLSGTPETVLPQVQELLSGLAGTGPLEQLIRVISALEGTGAASILRFDFSVVDDAHYYNGIVFKGFADGLPESVLSGGQYDKLMRKMHRSSGAIGFAVYMDMLDRLDSTQRAYDVDVLLLYDGGTALSDIRRQAEALTQSGSSVLVQRCVPENIRYKKLLKLDGSEVRILENNA